MKKILFAVATLFLSLTFACAQETSPFRFDAETRLGWRGNFLSGETLPSATGFRGDYINIKLSGTIADNFTYVYRQRLNRIPELSSFFNAVDFLYLDWTPGDWTFSAGKQVVLIGGYEYDRAPIDLYICSEYWQNIACYQLGVSGAYNFGADKLTLQVCQSPYQGISQNLYAYNLMWNGSHDWYSSIWSVNMIEHSAGKYLGYLALGNCFRIGDFKLELDFMDRFANASELPFKDFSVMSELAWRPIDALNVFAKATYDYNDSPESPDFCVLPGTKLLMAGIGAEYYPIKGRDDVRIFAFGAHVSGTNGNPSGTLLDGMTMVEAGLKVKINLKK